MNRILVTGSAGFIGYHLSDYLCDHGYEVTGIDNINEYYSVRLKEDRLEQLEKHKNFEFRKIDLADRKKLDELIKDKRFDYVINLAAQAGVRYSIENPLDYIQQNITAFGTLLEVLKENRVKYLIFASSSSVYGANKKIPFSTKQKINKPISMYAASKAANELMAYTYCELYGLQSVGLRFFTVYGPWGRPDMAYYSFTKKILKGETIDVYNYGKMERDFTYIDDIVKTIERVIGVLDDPIKRRKKGKLLYTNGKPASIFNIGHNEPVELMYFIKLIEKYTGKKAKLNLLPRQQGDLLKTYADIDSLIELTGVKPSTSIESGMKKFVDWYRNYYAM